MGAIELLWMGLPAEDERGEDVCSHLIKIPGYALCLYIKHGANGTWRSKAVMDSMSSREISLIAKLIDNKIDQNTWYHISTRSGSKIDKNVERLLEWAWGDYGEYSIKKDVKTGWASYSINKAIKIKDVDLIKLADDAVSIDRDNLLYAIWTGLRLAVTHSRHDLIAFISAWKTAWPNNVFGLGAYFNLPLPQITKNEISHVCKSLENASDNEYEVSLKDQGKVCKQKPWSYTHWGYSISNEGNEQEYLEILEVDPTLGISIWIDWMIKENEIMVSKGILKAVSNAIFHYENKMGLIPIQVWKPLLCQKDVNCEKLRECLVRHVKNKSNIIMESNKIGFKFNSAFPLRLPEERELLFLLSISMIKRMIAERDCDVNEMQDVLSKFILDHKDLDAVAEDESASACAKFGAVLLSMLHRDSVCTITKQKYNCIKKLASEMPDAMSFIVVAIDILNWEEDKVVHKMLSDIISIIPFESATDKVWIKTLHKWREKSRSPVTNAGALNKWVYDKVW